MSTKLSRVFIVLVLLILFAQGVFSQLASADYLKLSTRSLNIGSSQPGAITDYVISLSWQAPTFIGSIKFLICEDYVVDLPCSSTPAGADLSSAVLTAQTGALGGFAVLSQDNDEIIITRGLSGNTGTGMHSFTFDDIVNPTGLHDSFYIQIFTYASADATGVPTHMSSVASAIAEPIVITSIVPPILYFCAGLTIDTWCENVAGDQIDYGNLSTVTGHTGTSQFGVATNAAGGYVVTINGNTMTSGTRVIPELSAPAAFTTGVAQFWLNLRANTNPAIGQDVSGEGIGTVDPDYDVPDLFQYIDGDDVASSVTGTMFNIFTVTYIVNIPPTQPSGVYNTTVAYICTAAF